MIRVFFQSEVKVRLRVVSIAVKGWCITHSACWLSAVIKWTSKQEVTAYVEILKKDVTQMNNRKKIVIVTLTLLCTVAAFKARGKVKTELLQEKVPSTIVKQLPLENGVIPVEVQRQKAYLALPNEVSSYSCVVKNNTAKAITGLALEWTFTVETNGSVSTSSEYSSMDAIVHPDIQSYHRLRSIASGSESTLESSGEIGFAPSAKIVKIEATVRYVEFDDKSTIDLEPSTSASLGINQVREGATRYKQWLSQMYKKNSDILLQVRSDSFPSELELKSASMKQGAKMYRGLILSLYAKNQSALVERYLTQ